MSNLFHGLKNQKEIYGHDLLALHPLTGAGASAQAGKLEGDESDIKAFYDKWLQGSDFAENICFLDITFGADVDSESNRTLTTLILTPFQDSTKAYREDVLNPFFGMEMSIAAHPLFRAGLPVFREINQVGLKDGEEVRVFPESSRDMRKLYANAQYELADDGFLQEKIVCKGIEAVAEQRNADTERQFDGLCFLTFQGTKLETEKIHSEYPIAKLWNKYVDLLGEQRARLRSKEGRALGTVIAAPLGVRDPANLGRFSWIADVYIGFDCKIEEPETKQFIRQLFLQLLRTNAALKTRIEAREYVRGSFAHEIKSVTSMIGESWVVPPSLLFDVAVVPADEMVASAAGRRMVGRLELNEDFSFLRDSLRVVPFEQFLRKARQTIDLWSMRNAITGLDMTLDRSVAPREWAEVLRYCWKLARDQEVIRAIASSDSPNTPERIRKIESQWSSALEVFRLQQPIVTGSIPSSLGSFDFIWNENDPIEGLTQQEKKERVISSFALLRTLIAWFSNCIQHGDRTKPIQVSLRDDPDESPEGEYFLAIENAVARPSGSLSSQAFSQAPKLGSSVTAVTNALFEVKGSFIGHGPVGNDWWKMECKFIWKSSQPMESRL